MAAPPPTPVPPPRYLAAGDLGLVVEFGDRIDPAINRRVHDLFVVLDAARMPGIVDLVPTYRSLLITYDPQQLPLEELRRVVEATEQGLSATPGPAPRVIEVPTAYGGEFGPDLSFVASHNHLTEAEVIAIHSGTDYLVYMMGFSPGFPYLGGMSERIAAPRLDTPRTAIPAGSVGIAQAQTGIYPVESPGGWRVIGRTPIALFDPFRTPPVLVEAGDYIRFVPMAPDDYHAIGTRVARGAWQPVIHSRQD